MDGWPRCDVSSTRRTARAVDVASPRSPLRRVAALDDEKPWEHACQEGWEGVIAKRRDSRLRASSIAELAEDEVRGEPGTGRRRLYRSARRARSGLGRAAGRILRETTTSSSPARSGTGFDTKLLLELRATARPPRDRRSRHSPRRPACHVFVRTGCDPRSSCRSHSSNGRCTTSFAIRGCWAFARTKPLARSHQREAVITHPDKVLFPDDGITKGALAAYYEAIALDHAAAHSRPPDHDGALPVRHRPEGLHPEGCVQRVSRAGWSAWKFRRRTARFTIPSSTDTPFAVVARQSKLHHAARVDSRAPICTTRISVSSTSIRHGTRSGRAARCCARACAICWTSSAFRAGSRRPARKASTSLSRSTARPTSAPSHRFAHTVGTVLVSRDPKRLTQEFSKADRGGRILVDTGRNGYSATFAAPYAVRAKPGAPISAPCTWEEVEKGDVHPQTFTLQTIADRINAVGDLWSTMRKRRYSIVSRTRKLIATKSR